MNYNDVIKKMQSHIIRNRIELHFSWYQGRVPRCRRCGDEEFRINGYCSVYCEDMDDVENELHDMSLEIENLKNENKNLRREMIFFKKAFEQAEQELSDYKSNRYYMK